MSEVTSLKRELISPSIVLTREEKKSAIAIAGVEEVGVADARGIELQDAMSVGLLDGVGQYILLVARRSAGRIGLSQRKDTGAKG